MEIIYEDKSEMILVYANSRNNYFRSYNLGTGEIIAEKALPRKFKYGYPLLSYLATA